MTCTCPQGFPDKTYVDIDSTCKSELANPVTAHKIINQSKFCTNIPKGFLQNDPDDVVTADIILLPTYRKTGIYHLWNSEEKICAEHGIYKLKCLYVGKGSKVHLRVKDHLKNKYEKEDQLLVSFYECSNRIAKYLEQLFLDMYNFELNTAENNKNGPSLYAYWNYQRCMIGTETDRIADFLAREEMNREEAAG